MLLHLVGSAREACSEVARCCGRGGGVGARGNEGCGSLDEGRVVGRCSSAWLDERRAQGRRRTEHKKGSTASANEGKGAGPFPSRVCSAACIGLQSRRKLHVYTVFERLMCTERPSE